MGNFHALFLSTNLRTLKFQWIFRKHQCDVKNITKAKRTINKKNVTAQRSDEGTFEFNEDETTKLTHNGNQIIRLSSDKKHTIESKGREDDNTHYYHINCGTDVSG